MAAFVATYTYATDSAERRSGRLDDHLAFIDRLETDGVLQLVGKVEDASVDVLFVLRADSLDAATSALQADPYREIGAIDAVTIHPWNAKRGVLGPI
ncbi:MAG: YciI family protein [Aeromicrobium sp.]